MADYIASYLCYITLGNPILYTDPSGTVTINPYPGMPSQKSCGVLLASILWLTGAIEKRISELKPGSLNDFGPNSMWGHAVQIHGLQISLMLHVNEFFKRCQPPQYGPQPDWQRVQQAYQADPVELAFPNISGPFQVWMPLLVAGGALLLLAAILAAPVVVPAVAAAAIVGVIFFGTWLGSSLLEGEYQQTSFTLLMS